MGGLLLASNVVTLSSSAPTLALMIGLAVGIDYTLFILSRHRTQLATGMDPEESAARATGTAGSAVVFAGLTVVIALSGLAVVGIPFLTVMGVGAAGTVLVAVLVALTLLPALLGFAGSRLAPKPGSRAARRELADAAADDAPAGSVGTSAGARWTRLITRRPLLTVVLVLAGLLALAIPAPQLQLALPDNSTAAPDSPAAAGLRPGQRVLRPGAQRAARRPRRGPRPGDGAAVRRGDGGGDRRHADRYARRVRGRARRRGVRPADRAARRDDGPDHRDPRQRPAGRGDERPGRRPARPAPRPGAADRRGHRRHRPDGGRHRRLRPARRRAAAVRARRRRAGPGPAAARLPLDPGADQGRARVPALGRLRRSAPSSPSSSGAGSAVCSAWRRPARSSASCR